MGMVGLIRAADVGLTVRRGVAAVWRVQVWSLGRDHLLGDGAVAQWHG